MRLLVLGGTKFLGRHIVDCGQTHGHELTLFNRGQTDPSPIPGVEQIHGDREHDLARLAGRSWDAVIDTSGYRPRAVRASARAPGRQRRPVRVRLEHLGLRTLPGAQHVRGRSYRSRPACGRERRDGALRRAQGFLRARRRGCAPGSGGRDPAGSDRGAVRSDQSVHVLGAAAGRGRAGARARRARAAGPADRRARSGRLERSHGRAGRRRRVQRDGTGRDPDLGPAPRAHRGRHRRRVRARLDRPRPGWPRRA